MEQEVVLRIIGTSFSKEKEEEINIWYITHHIPLILTGPAVAGERFRRTRLEEDKAYRRGLTNEKVKVYPDYLAVYEFGGEKALNDYLKSPLFDFAWMDKRYSWPDAKDFKVLWTANYRRIAKRGSDEQSRAFVMLGSNTPRGVDEVEYNRWYTNDHIVFVLRNPEVIRAERYQRIGNDESYPKYLAIYRYKDEKTLNQGVEGWLGKLAVPDRRKVYPDGIWDWRWMACFKLISKERKDLVV